MDGQIDQLLAADLSVVGVADVLADALGALIVLRAAADDHLLKIRVIGVRLTGGGLEQPLGEVAQMHHEAVEIQGFPVKRLLIEVLHHLQRPLDEPGDLVHHAHAGVQLGVDDMQRDKRRLAGVQLHLGRLLDGPQAVLAQVVLRGVVAHDRPLQGVGELDPLLLALQGEADVVGQRDEEGFIEGRGDLCFDVFDQALGQLQVLYGDLPAQLPQLPLPGLPLHAVGLFKQHRVDALPDLALEADALAGDDHLPALLVHHAEKIVIDDFFDTHNAHPLSPCQKNRTNPVLYAPRGSGGEIRQSWSSPANR